MKEKNLNSSNSGQDQFQVNFSAESQGHEGSQDLNDGNDDEQETSTDEYDNYAPWG
jgi:hypothetical protein